MNQQLPFPLSLLESYFHFSGSSEIIFFPQPDWAFRHFLSQVGLSLSCTYSSARQRARSACFGVGGVEVISRQLCRQKELYPDKKK